MAGVEREAAIVFAGVDGTAFGLVQQSAPHEKTNDALSDRSLQVHNIEKLAHHGYALFE
jgi:hypothetical protein